jgi:hypothetical protein
MQKAAFASDPVRAISADQLLSAVDHRKMIRLALRTIFATNKETLVEISNQVVEWYRERARSQRVTVRESFQVSIPCTQMEFAAILNGIIQPCPPSLSTMEAVCFCCGLPLVLTFMDDGSPMQIRVIVDLILWIVPLHVRFASALSSVGIPFAESYFARVVSGGLLNVLSIQISHRQRLEFVPVVLKTGAISGLMHVTAYVIQNYLTKTIPFIPEEVWSVVFAMLLDTFIQRLVRFDFLSTVDWIIEKIVKVVFDLVRKELEELPESCEIPESLACPICSQVLQNPVVVLGWLVCEDCLRRWMSVRARHPCTGEPISAELVEQSVLMTIVADKWHGLALRDVLQ